MRERRGPVDCPAQYCMSCDCLKDGNGEGPEYAE